MKTDFTFFCRTWIGIAYASGLVIGLPMTPPILDSPRDDLVIPVHETLSITCRGQHTLAWTWPDKGVVGKEPIDRPDQQQTTRAPGQRVALISECPGKLGRPYCKRLVLNETQGIDTGYYSCYYKDVKAIVDGTTAVRIYVFVRDPAQPFLKRSGLSNGNASNLETILVRRSSTHVIVPCLVTVPDANVTLHRVFLQYPTVVQMNGSKWDNKRGWSIPRYVIDSMQLTFVSCVATLEGKDYYSTTYILHTAGTQVNDVKLFPEDSVELMVGEALTLNCTATVEFDTGVDIQWSYPGKQANRQVEISPYREALSQATVAGSVLTIHSVNVTDSGPYNCNVTSMEKTQTLQTIVTVYGESFINLDYREGPVVEVTDGQQSFKLQVNVYAYPTPETQWYKDGQLINTKRMEMHSNHSLEIKEVCQADSGLYTVVLTNSGAMLEERLNITLVVNVPPQIHGKEVIDPSSPYLSGSSQMLTCTAYGLPTPNITWQWRALDSRCVLNSTQSRLAREDTKDWSDEIADSQNWQDIYSPNAMNEIEFIETSVAVVNSQEKIISRLQIRNASVSVVYKCSAENKVGKDELQINFYVTTIPMGFSVDVHPSENPLEQENVSLCCKADNCFYDQLQWYRLNPQALLDQQGKHQELDCGSAHFNSTPLQGQSSFQEHSNHWVLHFNIESIRLQDEGHYVCKAQSRHREEKQCLFRYITVKALEAPRYKRSLTNQTVNVTESLRMECDVEGRPLPFLSWFKDNQPLHQMSGIQLQDSNRTLSIQRVREEDAGVYTCTACNKRGCVNSSAAIRVIGSSDKANVEIVILIGTGVIAVFFWALLILIFCNVKRVNPADIKTGYLSIIMDPGEVPLDEQCEYLPYDSSQWEISRDRLQLGKVLGHGAFGKVIEASIYGINKSNSLDTVAVKMLKDGATASEHKALMSELKILIHIGNHLNVVNLLGACTKPNGPLMVIVEYCKYGNLSNFLRAKREFFLPYRDRSPKTQSQVRRMIEAGQMDQRARQPPPASSSPLSSPQNASSKASNQNPTVEKMEDLWKTPLTIEDLICYSFQVARGMEFLASRKCIHRDLAARNILLSENNIVKICDFGLARDIYKDPDYVRKGNARLPLKWMAPESIFDKVYTSQSDVWSFGVLLWEIFSLGASPYPGVQIDEDFCKQLKDGVRMRAPETASPEIYGIMLACWHGEPKERPTFPALVQILGDLLQDNSLPDGKDYIPLNHSQNSEDDGFSQVSSRPASEEELRLACNTLPTRYYNCVPFAGCVFVGPSKICQPRVKTFEELPLEMHPPKSPQDNQTDSGMVLASEEFERIEHNHMGAVLKSRMSSTSSTEPLTASHSFMGQNTGTDSSRHRPNFFSQLSGQTFYNNEYGHLSEEGFCDFYSSPDTPCLASSNV